MAVVDIGKSDKRENEKEGDRQRQTETDRDRSNWCLTSRKTDRD